MKTDSELVEIAFDEAGQQALYNMTAEEQLVIMGTLRAVYNAGLTDRRNGFAKAAMHGLMCGPNSGKPSWVAFAAIEYADALIAELDRPVTE